jgi:hypothetical protein
MVSGLADVAGLRRDFDLDEGTVLLLLTIQRMAWMRGLSVWR